MSRGVQRARVDNNHADVIQALRDAGMTAVSLAAVGSGVPDIAAGWRGITCLLEVKRADLPPSKRALTVDERNFHETWGGHVCVVTTPEDAVLAVIEHARSCMVIAA